MEEIRIGIPSSSGIYPGKLEGQRIQITSHEWELFKTRTGRSEINEEGVAEIELTIREISIEEDVEVREQLQKKGCHFFLEVYQEGDGFGVVISCVPLRRKRIVRGVDYIDWYRKRPPSVREVLTGTTRLIRRQRERDRW